MDTDGDGTDDYLDDDDDDDGINDSADADRLGAGIPDVLAALREGELSYYTLIAGAESAVAVPTSQSGENTFVAELYPDGSAQLVGYRLQGNGRWEWSSDDQRLVLVSDQVFTGPLETTDTTDNFIVSAYDALDQPAVEYLVETTWELALTNDGQFEDHWLMPRTTVERTYVLQALDDTLLSDFVVDVSLPIRVGMNLSSNRAMSL